MRCWCGVRGQAKGGTASGWPDSKSDTTRGPVGQSSEMRAEKLLLLGAALGGAGAGRVGKQGWDEADGALGRRGAA